MRNEELGMKVAASPRIYMRRCPKFETGGFLVSQTQSLATNPQLLISSHQSLPLVFPFPHAIIKAVNR